MPRQCGTGQGRVAAHHPPCHARITSFHLLLITYFIKSIRVGRAVKRFTKTTGRCLGTVTASQGLRNERADIAALGSAHFSVAGKTGGG